MFNPGEIVTCVDIKGSFYNGIRGPDLKTIRKGRKYKVVANSTSWSYSDKIIIEDDRGTRREYLSSRFKIIIEPHYKPRKIIRDYI